MMRAQLLRDMFAAAIAAADPAICIAPHLPAPPKGRTIVLGAGKAAASMARAVEQHWPGPLEGLVVTRYGHGAPTSRIEVVEAAHPVPDAAGFAAAERILALAQSAGADDLVLCLISGGGSALLTLPAPGVTLAEKQAVNRALLASGAGITEMNCVRKHLSAIKGGQLAAACAPARVVSLVISDVPGDDLAVIASGPTVADPTTRDEAAAILARLGVVAPPLVETPKPGDAVFARVDNKLVGSGLASLEAAADVARKAGFHPLVLGDFLEGEAREMALFHAGLVRHVLRGQGPAALPCAIISGGEARVTAQGGRGGRNSEFLLALALALEGAAAHALAGDTDGIDGTQDNAGAVMTPDTMTRAKAAGLDARAMLDAHVSYDFFEALGDLVVTGPTLTNVNDVRIVLVG
jgi:hydroxypyruvate reductase